MKQIMQIIQIYKCRSSKSSTWAKMSLQPCSRKECSKAGEGPPQASADSRTAQWNGKLGGDPSDGEGGLFRYAGGS